MTALLCRHANISWPMTVGGKTTVVCHDCLRRLPYSWPRMQIVPERRACRDLKPLAETRNL